MELIYLWIEDYKNIKEQGFNFSGRYRCEYDREKNELTINENKDYVDIFPDNINVTAIVGKNGSGKSSIFERLIAENYYDMHVGIETIPDSAEYKTIVIYCNVYNQFFVNVVNNTKMGYILRQENSDYKKIFCSNSHFENQIVREDRQVYYGVIERQNFSMRKFRSNFTKLLSKNLHSKNIKIETILKSFGVNLPNYIALEENRALNNNNHVKACFSLFHNKLNAQKIRTLQQLSNSNDVEVYFYSLFFFNILNDIVHHKIEFDTSAYKQELNGFIADMQNITPIEAIKRFFNNSSIEYINNIEQFLQILLNNVIVEHNDLVKEIKTRQLFLISLADIGKEFFELLSLIDDEILRFHYIQFRIEPKRIEYIHLSSGEMASLNLIMNVLQGIIDTLEETTNLMILIDEYELFMHPEWQRIFLNILIDILKDDFLKERKLHIVFSSHSPFLLSDIPFDNIIFVNKDENGQCKVVDGLRDKKQTFGANIHTLLGDAFFMQDGLMGQYAKTKINELIDHLNSKESPIKDNDEAQRYINIIGEPILKKQLQRMLDSKRLSKIDEIDLLRAQVSEIQQKINKLENGK